MTQAFNLSQLANKVNTSGQVDVSTGLTGTISSSNLPTTTVDKGGTGATTLTANNILLGNGTSAVQFVAPGTAGNVLTSNGTTWSSSAGSSITATSGTYGSLQPGGFSTSSAGSYTKVATFVTAYAGTYNASFYLRGGGGLGWGTYAQIFVNGVARGTERMQGGTSSTFVNYQENITVNAGDLVQLYQRAQSGYGTTQTNNFGVGTASGQSVPVLPIV
jgi:hypothetical protein